MNCAAFYEILPDALEGDQGAEQAQHMRSCGECSEIFSDLKEISLAGPMLQATDEPNARVWNLIEIALRQEGIIRDAKTVSLPAPRNWWKVSWLAPVTALLLLISAFLIYQQKANKPSKTQAVEVLQPQDQQLLQELADRAPAMRATYAANLQNVNSYIRSAEASVQSDPNDEDARQSLMAAYDQRSMVYAMALERTLP